jgi:hypothetical protein
MGGYVEAAAAIYSAVQTKEDAHHAEHAAASAQRQILADKPVTPTAIAPADQAQRDQQRRLRAQNVFGRQDTILAGGQLGQLNAPTAPTKTLLGS